MKKLESFTALSRRILTQIASELKKEKSELNHKLIAADEEIKANNEEMEKLTIDKTALKEELFMMRILRWYCNFKLSTKKRKSSR